MQKKEREIKRNIEGICLSWEIFFFSKLSFFIVVAVVCSF